MVLAVTTMSLVLFQQIHQKHAEDDGLTYVQVTSVNAAHLVQDTTSAMYAYFVLHATSGLGPKLTKTARAKETGPGCLRPSHGVGSNGGANLQGIARPGKDHDVWVGADEAKAIFINTLEAHRNLAQASLPLPTQTKTLRSCTSFRWSL